MPLCLCDVSPSPSPLPELPVTNQQSLRLLAALRFGASTITPSSSGTPSSLIRDTATSPELL
uniref:Uncharacterized protein n=1 Tax=Ascaris lumbricoides TaxID=6252 RepID=A0A0M3I0N9_ASCLU